MQEQSYAEWINSNHSFPITAVEWLEGLHKKGILISKSFDMAKEIEKEQIINAYNKGNIKSEIANIYAEKYYNKTYNK